MGNPPYAGYAYGIGAGALWGTVFLALQILAEFSPLEITAGRFITYGALSLVLIAPLWRRIKAKITWRDVATLLWLSMLGNIVYHVLLTASVHWVGIPASALIIGLLPVTIAIAGIRPGDAVALRTIIGPLCLIVVGIVCINIDAFTDAHAGSSHGLDTLAGIACASAALAAWTIYAVANARYLSRRSVFSSAEWSLLTGLASGAGAVLLAVPLILADGKHGLGVSRDWGFFWLVIGGIAIVSSIFGNGFWNAAGRRLPVAMLGQMIVFETLFGLLYGFLYAQQWPNPLQWIAIVLLPTGVVWAARLHASAATARRTP